MLLELDCRTVAILETVNKPGPVRELDENPLPAMRRRVIGWHDVLGDAVGCSGETGCVGQSSQVTSRVLMADGVKRCVME